jgi:hypothetical protein
VEALARNTLASQSELYVFLDGPKSTADTSLVSAVREQVSYISGFRSVTVKENNTNLGLSESVSRGVTQILDSYEQVIVLEDDMITSPYFLEYMNDGLAVYRQDANVASIHGFMYKISNLPETFFMKGADCWGWATWKRAWAHYQSDGQSLLNQLQSAGLEEAFNLDGAAPYSAMLADQIAGRNDSWAIRWHASAFLGGMFTLHPGKSFVRNIGLDASGTHCGCSAAFDTELTKGYTGLERVEIAENQTARSLFKLAAADSFDSSKREAKTKSFPTRVGHVLDSLLSRLRI